MRAYIYMCVCVWGICLDILSILFALFAAAGASNSCAAYF